MQITVEAIRQLVGREVCVQFRGPFIPMQLTEGQLLPVVRRGTTASGEKVEEPAHVPFWRGKVVEHEGVAYLRYPDPGGSGKHIEVLLDTGWMLAVHAVDERTIVTAR